MYICICIITVSDIEKKKRRETFTCSGKTPFLSLFQDLFQSSPMLLLHFTLSPLCEAKHLQGCCGGVIPLHKLSVSSSFSSSSSLLLQPWCSLCCFSLLPPPLSLPLPVGLCFSPFIFLHSLFGWQAQLWILWGIHLSQLEAASSHMRLPRASSHKSQPCSPPAASTLKPEQNVLPYSAKWDICCEVWFGLFEKWDYPFFEGQLCWIRQ